jgi:hypothetical protein
VGTISVIQDKNGGLHPLVYFSPNLDKHGMRRVNLEKAGAVIAGRGISLMPATTRINSNGWLVVTKANKSHQKIPVLMRNYELGLV